MYVDTAIIKRNGKLYTRNLLRTSYRENGKVKHKTIANLSSCSEEEIKAIKLALKNKNNLSSLVSIKDIKTELKKRIGAVWVLYMLAKRIGITKALGSGNQAKLALLQVMARVINQGSRLSAVRFAMSHAACEVIGIDKLDEDDLYENFAWIAEQQENIERKLFKLRFSNSVPTLFLYDVTSSYLEGVCNELGSFGYNRDKKKGKMQIVVGLLSGPDGCPIAVRVFQGNTSDTMTVSEQIRTLAESFGVKEVTLVGDRGMLKGPQINALPDDFRYITAITKPQILKMLSEGLLQYELFTEEVCEVEQDGIRYILRRNPMRAEQLAKTRGAKFASLQRLTFERNKYLAEHSKANVDVAMKKVQGQAKKLKIDKWINVLVDGRSINLEKDASMLSEVSLLDGCYVIKSDVSKKNADTQELHDRYCDLENVERAFRTMKTSHLEMRPVYVRKEASTRGHVFVVMLALLLQRELESCWSGLDITVEEGIDELAAIHIEEMNVGNTSSLNIPNPNNISRQLLDAAHVQLPAIFPSREARVHTKKKLSSRRYP